MTAPAREGEGHTPTLTTDCTRCFGDGVDYDGNPCRECKGAKVLPLLDVLTKKYTEEVIPPCRVCGSALSIGAAGGGMPTRWACSPWSDEPGPDGKNVLKPGRTTVDDHYGQSGFTQHRHGDDNVLALVKAYEALAAQSLAPGAVAALVECVRLHEAWHNHKGHQDEFRAANPGIPGYLSITTHLSNLRTAALAGVGVRA